MPEHDTHEAAARRTSVFADVVVKRLAIAIAVLVIAWLGAMVFVLVYGLPEPAAPRTASERALMVYEAQVQSGEADVAVWSGYIRALIDANQYAKAEQTLDLALASLTEGRSLILIERARLSYVRGDVELAVEQCDETLAEVELEIEAERRDIENRVSGMSSEPETPAVYGDALVLKASALADSGDTFAAIEAYTLYLDRWSTAADVLVARAELLAQTGDLVGAEADYRAALKFGPDYKPALDGLASIGASDQ